MLPDDLDILIDKLVVGELQNFEFPFLRLLEQDFELFRRNLMTIEP